jgi:hypothetical protein
MIQRCVIAIVLLVLGCGVSQAQIELKWKLKAGDTFYLETTSNSKQSMKTVGRELKQEIEQASVFQVKIEKVNDDKSMVLEQKLEWLTVKVGNATQPDDRYNQQLAGLAFKATLNAKGEVTQFDGYKEMLEKITGNKDEKSPEQEAVRAVLSEASLKESVAEAFAMVPEKPIKIADTWDRKSEKPLGPLGSLLLTRKFTYDAQETVEGKPLEKLSFTGTGQYAPPRKGGTSPFQFTIADDKSDVKVEGLVGTAFFDAAAGRLVKTEWSMRFKALVTISVGGGSAVQTEAVQDLTIKTRVLNQMPAKPMGGGPGGTPGGPGGPPR